MYNSKAILKKNRTEKKTFNNKLKTKIMFEKPFSFDGRIRRTEYGISVIIYVIIYVIILGVIESSNGDAAFLGLAFIPMLWFIIAQAAKRCHDVGNSGWWQLIPFYGLWLLFQEGNPGQNEYGDNPKGKQQNNNTYNPTNVSQQQQTSSTGGYNQGNYSGGHNNHNNIDNSNNQFNPNKNNSSGEYKSGELYK
jgi:uncharacterized membrane protein YhaH (DUF805 family)